MGDGPSPAKKLKTDLSQLPECPYGAKCYRKNPQHFKEYSHSSSGSSDTTDNAKVKDGTTNDRTLPPCTFGAKCYRKNLLHFAEFSHPVGHSSKEEESSGSETEVYDSDNDKDDNAGKEDNILSKGLSLVKKYSQMTDEERKELIKQAFDEKARLQKELEKTRKEMAEKKKELEHLHRQLNNGMLLMEGEEEALKKNKTTYFPLMAERKYKEGSASQIHFRLAESQFYRLLGDGQSCRVTKVEYVVSPKLVKRFREYQEQLKKKHGEDFSYPVLGFHGTDQKNIVPICENGFKTPGDADFQHRTDAGYYGAGVYFSEYPSYSIGYIRGGSKLMLCQVLPGKVYKCDSLMTGAPLEKGYDSHMSPCKCELVIFNSAAILPSYIIYFTRCAAPPYLAIDPDVIETAQILDEYTKASTAKPTKVFSGKTITLSGKMVASQTELYKLITTHGGKKGSRYHFDILVASKQNVIEGFSRDVLQAIEDDLPIVPESFLYQCIIQKKKLKPHDFEYDVHLPD